MSDEFERDLAEARGHLSASRAELLDVIRSLQDADLDRGRRGGWPVRRVLQHVIESEHAYARLVLHLRGLRVPGEPIDGRPTSVADARERLDASRSALLEALAGVEEEAFYALKQLGHEEYSILSVLENAIHHDREHAGQIRATLAATG
jgi:uncharacterized damage-inducible protein DinB